MEDQVHVENGDTDLILSVSQMEILLEACNASISCILTLVLYPCRNGMFVTNIGSILKDG